MDFTTALLIVVFRRKRQTELAHHQRTVDYLTGWCGMTRAQAEGAIEDARDMLERDPLRYVRAADVGDWREVRQGLWYSPTAQESRHQQSRPGSRAHTPPSQQPSGKAPSRAPGHPTMPTPPAPAGPHFRRAEAGFARAVGGVWNGAHDPQHPADISVFKRDGTPFYYIELKDRPESMRGSANINRRARMRKMQQLAAAMPVSGTVVPFVSLLPMWQVNAGGSGSGIVVRYKLTFTEGAYKEAVIPGLTQVEDLNKPPIQQRLRELIEAEVRRMDKDAYGRALVRQSALLRQQLENELAEARQLEQEFQQRFGKGGLPQ
jgi:hypothetical protein